MSKLAAQGCGEYSSSLFCFGALELMCSVAAVIVRHPLAERMAFVNYGSPRPVARKSSGGRTIDCRAELGFGATLGSSPRLRSVNAYGRWLFAFFAGGVRYGCGRSFSC
jgi:hypothetical protein